MSLPALLFPHITESFVRASGPGGQNVNKVATAVELRFAVDAAPLGDDVKRRLRALAGKRLLADGALLIQAHEHRTQKQNREAARDRRAELIRRASLHERPRRATKPSAAARRRRLESKRRRSTVKTGRQRGRSGDQD
jgi:ribosome-associated protein